MHVYEYERAVQFVICNFPFALLRDIMSLREGELHTEIQFRLFLFLYFHGNEEKKTKANNNDGDSNRNNMNHETLKTLDAECRVIYSFFFSFKFSISFETF